MQLRRELGLVAATSVVVGTMIGSGIFFGPQIVAYEFASHGIEPTSMLVISVWLVGGLLVLLGALTFAELAAMYPESGGQYAYLREAFGPKIAFLQGWSSYFLGKGGSIAALAVAFGALLSELEGGNFFGRGADVTFVAIAMITLLTGINYVGVRFGGWVQTSTTALKVIALVLLGVVAFVATRDGAPPAAAPITGSGSMLAAFGLALVPALWAYDGWYNSSQVAEEVKDPGRNLPLSLIGGTFLVMLIYVAANLAYVHVLGPDALAGIEARLGNDVSAAESPAGTTARLVGGDGFATLILVGVLVSIFGSLNGVILTGARIAFAMARDGVIFTSIAAVHPRFATPWVSLVVLAVFSMALVAFFQTFQALITLVIFAVWLWVGLAALALFRLRRTQPDRARPYRVHGYPVVPALFVAASAIFTINLVIEDPGGSLAGAAIILAGLPIYWWVRRPKRRPDIVVGDVPT